MTSKKLCLQPKNTSSEPNKSTEQHSRINYSSSLNLYNTTSITPCHPQTEVGCALDSTILSRALELARLEKSSVSRFTLDCKALFCYLCLQIQHSCSGRSFNYGTEGCSENYQQEKNCQLGYGRKS